MTRLIVVLFCVGLLAVWGCGSKKPDCGPDTDGDGIANCDDPDDDGDGLDDETEGQIGTDPLSVDSDADGLRDDVELGSSWTYSPSGDTTTATVESDPTVPTLLVEVDYMTGRLPDPDTILRSVAAYEAEGMEAFFRVEGTALTQLTPLTQAADMEQVLSGSKDDDAYVHVVFAEFGNGTIHGTTHTVSPNDPALGHGNEPDPAASGAFVFAAQIAADFVTYQTAFNGVGITEPALAARTLVHEIGHTLGATHEGSAGGFDPTNVMISNSDVGNPNTDPARWQDATLGANNVGYPTFTSGAHAQLDLTQKVSVETATSRLALDFDMGPSAGPVGVDTTRVDPSSTYDSAHAYGWTEPAPTDAAEAGSDSSDVRTADYVAGDPAVVANTTFRVTGLGTGPLDVFIRLGATLNEPRQVRCEIVHPTLGVASLSGTIDAGGDFLQTSPPVFVNPVFEGTSLGYGTGTFDLVCLDGGGYADAPIEYVRVTKREP